MKKLLFDCGTRDATASSALLFLRASVGLMMLIGHGIPKIQKFSVLKDKFNLPDIFPLSLMSPPVSLMACIVAEVVASAMLVLGLMTRPAAFVFGFTMVVAAFGVHAADPWFAGSGSGSKELALMYLIPALAILLSGAGVYSLDASILKEGRRRRW